MMYELILSDFKSLFSSLSILDVSYVSPFILLASGGGVSMLTAIRTTTHVKKENIAK